MLPVRRTIVQLSTAHEIQLKTQQVTPYNSNQVRSGHTDISIAVRSPHTAQPKICLLGTIYSSSRVAQSQNHWNSQNTAVPAVLPRQQHDSHYMQPLSGRLASCIQNALLQAIDLGSHCSSQDKFTV
jgi:hypothetical protein